MALTGVHFLLTYRCTRECEHCFVFGSPRAPGAFTADQVCRVLDEAARLGTVNEVYFEGGEPFLCYDVLLAGARSARRRGWTVGVVTNAYWATSEATAERLLRPLAELGLADLSVSDDDLHANPERVAAARAAARRLGVPTGTIAIDCGTPDPEPGKPVRGGNVMYRGRAAGALADRMSGRHWAAFGRCEHEQLEAPERVHIDPDGFVHLCQGLAMGNCWERPFDELVRAYDPAAHPVAGALLAGGPAELARRYGLPGRETFADACHLCYLVRRQLRDRFPEWLGPDHVYGQAG